jgi:hypothetical protein
LQFKRQKKYFKRYKLNLKKVSLYQYNTLKEYLLGKTSIALQTNANGNRRVFAQRVAILQINIVGMLEIKMAKK